MYANAAKCRMHLTGCMLQSDDSLGGKVIGKSKEKNANIIQHCLALPVIPTGTSNKNQNQCNLRGRN